jgi:hypothetical protein
MRELRKQAEEPGFELVARKEAMFISPEWRLDRLN